MSLGRVGWGLLPRVTGGYLGRAPGRATMVGISHHSLSLGAIRVCIGYYMGEWESWAVYVF